MQLEETLVVFNLAPFCDRRPVPAAATVGCGGVQSYFVSLRSETVYTFQLSNLYKLIPPPVLETLASRGEHEQTWSRIVITLYKVRFPLYCHFCVSLSVVRFTADTTYTRIYVHTVSCIYYCNLTCGPCKVLILRKSDSLELNVAHLRIISHRLPCYTEQDSAVATRGSLSEHRLS
jgi:hypothetical protein